MREKNSRLKAIIKQNDSDFVKETVIWHGEFATHHSEFIVTKKLLNLLCLANSEWIRVMDSEFIVFTRNTNWIHSEFGKHQVYSYLIGD